MQSQERIWRATRSLIPDKYKMVLRSVSNVRDALDVSKVAGESDAQVFYLRIVCMQWG
jgi:hypothetical protein